MARYIHPEVKDRMESSPGDERLRLALVPTESGANSIREWVGQDGGEIKRELPSGIVLLETSVSQLPSLFEVEGIESISPGAQMEVLV